MLLKEFFHLTLSDVRIATLTGYEGVETWLSETDITLLHCHPAMKIYRTKLSHETECIETGHGITDRWFLSLLGSTFCI